MTRPVPHRHAMRRGTAADWTASNPVLAAGEEGYETDTHKRKVGDGATAWTGLPYSGLPGSEDLQFADNGDGTGSLTWEAGAQSAGVPTLSGGKVNRGVVPDPVAADISDATTVGKAVLTAADQAAAQAAIGVTGVSAPLVEEFTTSTTWTMAAGAKKVFVQVYGAGGGAGKTAAPGLSGAYKAQLFDAADITGSSTITVGTGGAGSSFNSGSAGGNSSTSGSIALTAAGGAAGTAAGAAQPAAAFGAPGGVSGSTSGQAGGNGLVRITTYF